VKQEDIGYWDAMKLAEFADC